MSTMMPLLLLLPLRLSPLVRGPQQKMMATGPRFRVGARPALVAPAPPRTVPPPGTVAALGGTYPPSPGPLVAPTPPEAAPAAGAAVAPGGHCAGSAPFCRRCLVVAAVAPAPLGSVAPWPSSTPSSSSAVRQQGQQPHLHARMVAALL